MTTKQLKTMVRAIYSEVQASGLTSHRYSDDAWEHVFELRAVAEKAARDYTGESVRCIITLCSTYPMSHRIYDVSIEDEYTGEVYGGGQITACYCGTMEHPWNAYDMCASWWANTGIEF